MVIDRLENSSIYEGLHTGLVKAFAFLRQNAGRELAAGRHEIDGDGVYALAQSYTTQPAAERKWESHRKYVDVQYVAAGREAIGYAPAGALCQAGEYVEAKDFQGYADGPHTLLRCEEGTFAIFWPDDLHRPCCELDRPCPVRKVVVKIKL